MSSACEFTTTFDNDKRTCGILKAKLIEEEICETIVNIHYSFHSTVNAFTALERKHDEIAGIMKLVQWKLWDHIVRIIVLQTRWIIANWTRIFHGDHRLKALWHQKIGNGAPYPFGFMGNCLDHLQQFDRSFRETCLAHQNLLSISLDSVEQQWRSLLKQRSFKLLVTKLKVLEYLHFGWTLEEYLKSSYWRNKVINE